MKSPTSFVVAAGLLSTYILAGCGKTPEAQRVQAPAPDPQVEAVLRDFPQGRLVTISIPDGQTIVLDRRTGCVYQQYHSLEPILDADGKPDCTYANRMTIESPPVRN